MRGISKNDWQSIENYQQIFGYSLPVDVTFVSVAQDCLMRFGHVGLARRKSEVTIFANSAQSVCPVKCKIGAEDAIALKEEKNKIIRYAR